MNPETHESSIGPVIGTIIILAVIILGGLYFWNERTKQQAPAPAADQTTADQAAAAQDTQQLNVLNTQSSSDDTASIQSDLNATNVNNLDSSLQTQ